MINILIIIFILLLWMSQNNQIDKPKIKQPIVTHFGIGIEIPNMPNKYHEGGFHLYFYSPDLKIKRLLAYRFNTGETIKHHFDITNRRIPFDLFKSYISNMIIYSNSHNVFNASKVMIYGIVENKTDFYGEKQIDPNLDRDHRTGYIAFKNIQLS